MSKGYFTIAQGAEYHRMAYALALSLKSSQPEELSKLSIGVTTDELSTLPAHYIDVFDNVIEIPGKDLAQNSSWKLENEWKALDMSPYDETIKLDADMVFTTDISHWWDLLEKTDGMFATDAVTYRGEKITNDYYRKVFTKNSLPNIYTAFFYFKKTQKNVELFKLAETIFCNWATMSVDLLHAEHRPGFVSTDVVFAIAAKLLNYTDNSVVMPPGVPTFAHMKLPLQNCGISTGSADWTSHLYSTFRNNGELIVGNYKQQVPFHYHIKSWLTDEIIEFLEKKVNK